MSDYAVIFAGGFFGTFLVHFINQHENFSKGEYVANYKHWSDGATKEDSPVHLNMPRHSLYYKPHMSHVEKFKGQAKLLDWEEFRALHDCKNLCIKPVPHHPEMFDDAYCDWLEEKATLIVCYIDKDKDKIVERCDKFGVTNGTDAQSYVDNMNKEALQLAQRRGAFILDMGSLMNCDIRTYGMLCVHLNVDPLFGWQDLVNKHKELIGFE